MKTFEEFRFSIPHNKVRGYKYAPNTKEEFVKAIEAEIKIQGNKADLNCIDTSNITDMSWIFGNTEFNGDISNWDISNVTNTDYMFDHARSFNQDISNWDVSNVKNMHGMFYCAENFNCDISGWNVSNVEDTRCMFWGARSFNQDISNWNVNNVKYFRSMFNDCPIKEEYKPI